MRIVIRALLISMICLISITTAFGRNPGAPPAVTVTGIYENFTIGKGSGDLEGMRVVIVSAGGGYYAIVQIAQGGAEDPKPEFVEAKVNGSNVSFAIGDQKFTGTATPTGMRIKSSAGQSQVLKRKPCASYFK